MLKLFPYILIFTFLHLAIFSVAQPSDTANIAQRIRQVQKEELSDPIAALAKYTELAELAQKNGYQEGMLNCAMGKIGILAGYKNDFKKVIEESFVVEAAAKALDDKISTVDAFRIRGMAYSDLGLSTKGYESFQEALSLLDGLQDSEEKKMKTAILYDNIGGYYSNICMQDSMVFYKQKVLEEAQKLSSKESRFVSNKYHFIIHICGYLGRYYRQIGSYDTAAYYLFKGDSTCKAVDTGQLRLREKLSLYSEIAFYYYEIGEYDKSINYGHIVLEIMDSIPIPIVREEVYKALSKSYLKIGNADSSLYFSTLYTNLVEENAQSTRLQVDAPVAQLINEKEKIVEQRSQKKFAIIISCLVVFSALAAWWYNRRQNVKIANKYKAIIEKIKEEGSLFMPYSVEVASVPPSDNNELVADEQELLDSDKSAFDEKPKSTITDQTLNAIIEKLNKFEVNDKFINADISLAGIASDWGTNTR